MCNVLALPVLRSAQPALCRLLVRSRHAAGWPTLEKMSNHVMCDDTLTSKQTCQRCFMGTVYQSGHGRPEQARQAKAGRPGSRTDLPACMAPTCPTCPAWPACPACPDCPAWPACLVCPACLPDLPSLPSLPHLACLPAYLPACLHSTPCPVCIT